MKLIWFNPDNNQYENGSCSDYQVITSHSSNSDRFEILYEFSADDPFETLGTKIIRKLNQARALAYV